MSSLNGIPSELSMLSWDQNGQFIFRDFSNESFDTATTGYDASCESLALSPSRRYGLGARTVSDISTANSIVYFHGLKKSNSMSKIESVVRNPETYWSSNLTPRSEGKLKLSLGRTGKPRRFVTDEATYLKLLTDSYGMELTPYSEKIIRMRIAEVIFNKIQSENTDISSPRNWSSQISPTNRKSIITQVVSELIQSTTLFYPFLERVKYVSVSFGSIDLSKSSKNIKELQAAILSLKEVKTLAELIDNFNKLKVVRENQHFMVQLLHEDPEMAKKLYKKLKEWNKFPEKLVESVVRELFRGMKKTELFKEGTLSWHRNRTRPLYTPYDKIRWDECFHRVFYIENRTKEEHVKTLNEIFYINHTMISFDLCEGKTGHELAAEWLKKLAISLIEKGFFVSGFGGSATVELFTEYVGTIFTSLHPQRVSTPLLFLLKNSALKSLYHAYLEHERSIEKVDPPPSRFFEMLRTWMINPKELLKNIISKEKLDKRLDLLREGDPTKLDKAEKKETGSFLKSLKNNGLWIRLLSQNTLSGNFYAEPVTLQKILNNEVSQVKGPYLRTDEDKARKLFALLQKLNTFSEEEFKFLGAFTSSFFDLILMSFKSGRFIGDCYYFKVNQEMLQDWNFKSESNSQVNIQVKKNRFSVTHGLSFKSTTVPYTLKSEWNLYHSQDPKDEAAWKGTLTIKPALLLKDDQASRFIKWRLDSGLLEPNIPKGQKKLKIRG